MAEIDDSNKGSSITSNDDAESSSESQPEPKFSKGQRVYAGDKDGVLYESIVRRSLYGLNHHRQSQAETADDEDNDATLSQEPQEGWFYFVHYQKWNVNWDRWVSEEDIFEVSDQVKMYAARLLKEVASLKKSLSKKVKGKKAFQTIDGAEFSQAWSRRRFEIEQEMKLASLQQTTPGNDKDKETNESKSPAKQEGQATVHRKKGTWNKQALATELSLRSNSLTQKRPASIGNNIPIPFTLKKNLVEQWEIISQCKMVPQLPAPKTIREALTMYVATKGTTLPDERNEAQQADDTDTIAKDSTPICDGQLDQRPTSDSPKASEKEIEEQMRQREWITMAEGLMMFFDEALPARLLFQEEIPQHRVMNRNPKFSDIRDVDMYGCEHLLRLLVRLPELIDAEFDEAEARPKLAKINDFVRFLNKNHMTLLTQNFRKLDEEEELELVKLEKKDAEKKRKLEAEQDKDSLATPAKKSRPGEEGSSPS